MTAEKFRGATDRIAADLDISLARLAAAVGVTAHHMSDCRVGRRVPSGTLVVALRAVAAAAPRLPEE